MQQSADGRIRAYFALADLTRMRVMRVMAATDHRGCLTQLSEALGLPASKVSKHVQVLVWAGLLNAERSGRRVWLTPRRGDPQIDYIQASLLAAPDSGGQFESDLQRFLRAEVRVD